MSNREEQDKETEDRQAYRTKGRIAELKAAKRLLERLASKKSLPAPMHTLKWSSSSNEDGHCVSRLVGLERGTNLPSENFLGPENRGEIEWDSINPNWHRKVSIPNRTRYVQYTTPVVGTRLHMNGIPKDIVVKKRIHNQDAPRETHYSASIPEVDKSIVPLRGTKGGGVSFWCTGTEFHQKTSDVSSRIAKVNKAWRKKPLMSHTHRSFVSKSTKDLLGRHTNAINDQDSPLFSLVEANSMSCFDWTTRSVGKTNSSRGTMSLVLFKKSSRKRKDAISQKLKQSIHDNK